jgi:hypothetical protein
MTGQYGADCFFVSSVDTPKTGIYVAAKYLKDAKGEYVIDPKTLKPYIVPADYDPAAVIARFISEAANLWTATKGANFLPGVIGPVARMASYETALHEYFAYQFYTGHPSDIQRSYNGLTGAPPVPDFINAASYSLGLATFAAGLPVSDSQLGGGALNTWTWIRNKILRENAINIDGRFNNGMSTGHDNAAYINKGYDAGQAHIFTVAGTPPASTGALGFTLSPDGATMNFPDGSASTRAINRDGTSTVSTASPNGNTSVITYDNLGNVISASTRTVNGDGTYTISNSNADVANSTTYKVSDDYE